MAARIVNNMPDFGNINRAGKPDLITCFTHWQLHHLLIEKDTPLKDLQAASVISLAVREVSKNRHKLRPNGPNTFHLEYFQSQQPEVIVLLESGFCKLDPGISFSDAHDAYANLHYAEEIIICEILTLPQ
ncbi:hypothetical protein PAAG_06608 [Paracoccidioides lutzii Pb01]|uniref:Uncharacterized protein n=1 Tax=Paracoccidioides lutzii (strain ATCC MYA-826 / Pb01) TaxID=502779 RepID=C1H767_PARBA|nr:hypothetical protein PAAG_06608 [Paracoccidioides lutzii Pb01]EEH35561.2 hypothetical protein PAAG_06608 [Paracoccidioides lutzii Pb01]